MCAATPARRAREGAAAPARRARGGAAGLTCQAREGEAATARGGEAAPPKEVKPPQRKVVLQPVAVVRAPALNADEATWSANLFHEAFMKL
jgi:hypothetical protein